jgi:diguanylate cyclase (GGDEF)-like protein
MNKAYGLEEATSDLEKFSKDVLRALIADNVPPTPSNFEIYFEKVLESKPSEVKDEILTILEIESQNEQDEEEELEKAFKEGFSHIRKTMQKVGHVYKNLKHLDVILKKYAPQIKNSTDKSQLTSLSNSLIADVSKLSDIIKKETLEMKDLYQKTALVVKKSEDKSIYDSQYGVYKKSYLIQKIAQERNLVEKFNNDSTLLAVRIKDTVFNSIKNERAKVTITRTVARLLLKTSRRSDIVAHYEDATFMIVLKHTDLENAKKNANRLKNMVTATNFFFGEKEVTIDVEIGLGKISKDRSAEESMVCVLDALDIAKEDGSLVAAICEKDYQE